MILKGVCITDACLPEKDVEIERISENSRDADEKTVFVALHGTRTDGERYIPRAFSKGCPIIVTENSDGIEGCFVKTPNARGAYAVMCSNLYRNVQNKMHCVAVTGTNGKTTVTYMLRHIFQRANVRCGLMGSIVNITPKRRTPADLTTLDPPKLYGTLYEMYMDGADYVFMEASSHALALDKTFALKFDVGILTNITSDHMDFHKNLDNYISAKSKLFAQSKISLYNRDDLHFESVLRRTGGVYRTYSEKHGDSDYVFRVLQHTPGGMKIDCNGAEFEIGSPARFNAYNAVSAFAAARTCGVDADIITSALGDFKMPPGRCETVSPPDAEFSVIIDFSHTPDSLENILKCGKQLTRKRLILVFGCGGDRDKTKRPTMGRIACRYADYTVITSDNSRSEEPEEIIKDILNGIDKNSRYEVIVDREQAIITALETACAGDCVILAGKGHEEYEITKKGKRRFSEREIVSRWFGGRE